MTLSRPSPMLRSLKVCDIDLSRRDWSNFSGDLGTACDTSIMTAGIQWLSGLAGCLTALDLPCFGEDDLRHAIRLLESLPAKAITLPNLVSACFEGWIDDLLDLIDHLDLPKIQLLNIKYDVDDEPTDPLGARVLFPIVPFPSLDILNMTMSKNDEECVLPFLPRLMRRCDKLKELHLKRTLFPMKALFATPSLDILCPHIMVLSVDGSMVDSDTTKAQQLRMLHDFFESRLSDKRIPTLKELSFGHDTDIQIEEASEYCELVEVVFHKGNRLG